MTRRGLSLFLLLGSIDIEAQPSRRPAPDSVAVSRWGSHWTGSGYRAVLVRDGSLRFQILYRGQAQAAPGWTVAPTTLDSAWTLALSQGIDTLLPPGAQGAIPGCEILHSDDAGIKITEYRRDTTRSGLAARSCRSRGGTRVPSSVDDAYAFVAAFEQLTGATARWNRNAAAGILDVFPGTWRVVMTTSGLAQAPGGTRTYTRLPGDSLTLEWSERDSSGVVRARGFIGLEQDTELLFYVSIAKDAPPVAITGALTPVSRVVDWRITPGVATEHPYNRELATSRLTVVDDDRMVWHSDQGGWRISFERIP
jgi:hypothetical protein